ncbi:2-methylcitrate dehydratase PrpD [Xylariaceae sp. FL1272]|nr:2-methylcitrate dehydratase PrpD [Xylariaceae sp. FL1272]
MPVPVPVGTQEATVIFSYIYNWAGCTIGGYEQSAPRVAWQVSLPFVPDGGNSSIYGLGLSADFQTAALVNGIASHANNYDDTHRDNPIHPSGPVLFALMAVADWKGGISGHELVTAIVVGVEAECKLGVSVYPEHYDIGWHITSTVGSVGAAVAIGKLLDLSIEQMQHAIGIAAVQVIGMHASFGTDTKSFHVSRAVQSGLLAALLAEQNFTASTEGLEDPQGWVNVVSTRNAVTEEFGTLGKTWEMSLNTFKPFPYDRIIHATIDGWMQIHDQMAEKGVTAADIINVTARCEPMVFFLTDGPTPQTGLAAKFSVYHAAAVALLDGKATPTQFTDAVVQNQTVIELREKKYEAFVSVEFEDGSTIDVHVEHCVGSYESPMTADQLKTKFLDQESTAWDATRAQKAFEYWSIIVESGDVSKVNSC